MSGAGGDIDRLVAESALRRLVTTYSRAVDRRDFPLLSSLYDDKAEDHHGHAFSGGRDDYLIFVQKALSAYDTTTHYVLNALFEIEGDTATGEVHKLNHHRAHDGTELFTGSRSHDRYIRREGVWRFLSRRIVLDWARRSPVDAAAYDDPAANSPVGHAGPEDASYALPLFAAHGQGCWQG